MKIRGEVLMNKNSFKAYNDALEEQGLDKLATAECGSRVIAY